jgi:hypothetical protein
MRDGADVLDVEWKPDWVPRFAFLHTTAELHSAPARFRAEEDEDGICWISSTETQSIELAERFDLRMFPFDVQVRLSKKCGICAFCNTCCPNHINIWSHTCQEGHPHQKSTVWGPASTFLCMRMFP